MIWNEVIKNSNLPLRLEFDCDTSEDNKNTATQTSEGFDMFSPMLESNWVLPAHFPYNTMENIF